MRGCNASGGRHGESHLILTPSHQGVTYMVAPPTTPAQQAAIDHLKGLWSAQVADAERLASLALNDPEYPEVAQAASDRDAEIATAWTDVHRTFSWQTPDALRVELTTAYWEALGLTPDPAEVAELMGVRA